METGRSLLLTGPGLNNRQANHVLALELLSENKIMKSILISLLLLVPALLFAQEKMTVDTNAVRSIDGIVSEMLHIISGEEGKKRDLEALRNLFLPTAQLTILNQTSEIPVPSETVSIEDFIELMKDPYYDEDFVEYEIGKTINEYNGIANVFQAYYVKDGDGMEEQGITSYQLLYFNDRWWIAHVMWTGDSNGVPVPGKYLKH